MKKRVVVTGVGAVTPLGNNAQATWNHIINGVSGIAQGTIFELDKVDVKIAAEVKDAISDQLEKLPRKGIAQQALQNSKVILLKTIDEAFELSNRYAPEHLIIASDNAELLASKVRSAGSVFLGNYSPESAGDYASGTNHTLPTNGYAAMYSGLSLDSFTKKISFQQLTKTGLENISTTVMKMAAAEGLEAHRNAVAIRLKN